MNIDNIKRIAELAQLQIEEDAIPEYAKNMTNILDLVDQMQAVDTDTIAPLAHPLEIIQRLREDVVTEVDQHKHYQQCAPEVERDMYLVPQVIEQE